MTPQNQTPKLEEVLEALRRFPQGSEVEFATSEVRTRRQYQGDRCFDVFAEELPDWTYPDTLVTQERADQIIEQAKSKAIHGPWSDQLERVMTPAERAEVMDKWDTMPGHTCFVHALLRLRNGDAKTSENHLPQG